MKKLFLLLPLLSLPLLLPGCAAVYEPDTRQDTQHEGGIVGTGNTPDCPQKTSKGKCVEQKP